MKLFVVFAATILAVTASSDFDQWVAFKQTHGKTYKNLAEEKLRFSVFQDNLRKIETQNARYLAGESRFTMKVNKFADLTKEEFKQKLGRQNKNKPKLNASLIEFDENVEIPTSVDWRSKAVLGVKDQGHCMSCWTFATTGALEGQNAIHNGKRIPLSEQQLLDCSSSYGNGNCEEGGYLDKALEYVVDHGIVSESSYPYEVQQSECRSNSSETVLEISGYSAVKPSEDQLAIAVANVGPISVGIDASGIQLYFEGIVDSDCEEEIDHGVLVVGYGEENGTEYWLLKNSWGENWGEEGYFRIAKDAGNICSVADDAFYPIL